MSSPYGPQYPGPNSGGYPQQPASPYAQYPGYGYGGQPPQNNGLAIASMVVSLAGIPLACVSFGFLLGLIGVILGHVGIVQIKRDGSAGRGMALTGIIVGYCLIAILLALIALFLAGMLAV